MIVDVSKKILIVGLGLLGGSYAKVLKRFGFPISAIPQPAEHCLTRNEQIKTPLTITVSGIFA